MNSGFNSSRLGIRGTEDLGGGLAVGFWLESPLGSDDGATAMASFSRRSTVSLIGPFGELRLGRDYSPTFWNDSVTDPFGQVGPGANIMLAASNNTPGFAANVTNYARVSNSVGYFLPRGLGGFYGQLMYAFHENTKYDPGRATPPGVDANGRLAAGTVPATRAGRYWGGRLGYAAGPFDIALGYSNNTTADSFYAGTTDFVNTWNLGVQYDFGFAKLTADLSRLKYQRDYVVLPGVGAVPDIDLSGYMLGVVVPVGVGTFRLSYGRVSYDIEGSSAADPRATKVAIGYVYNLSKRTTLYAIAARVNNRNGAALPVGNPSPAFVSDAVFTPRSSTGYVLGIRHAF